MPKKPIFNKNNAVSILKEHTTKHISFENTFICDKSDHFDMLCTSKNHKNPVKMQIVEVQTIKSGGTYCTYIYGLCKKCREYNPDKLGKRKIYWNL